MYAVIKTGGKQYKVQPGDTVRVEKIDGDEGKTIKFSEVLMLVDGEKVTVGTPFVKGTTVTAKVNAHGRGKKINVVKYKRRKQYRKQQGHRQPYTEVSIVDIKSK